MSSPQLKKFIEKVIRPELAKASGGQDKPGSARHQLTQVAETPAQFFVVVETDFMYELDHIMAGFDWDPLPDNRKKAIWRLYTRFLSKQEGAISGKVARAQAKRLRKHLNSGTLKAKGGRAIPRGANVYIIGSYKTMRLAKSDKLAEWVVSAVEKRKGKLETKNKELLKNRVTGAETASYGFELGHGEYGHASSALQATRVQQKIAKAKGLSDTDKDKLFQVVSQFGDKLNINIDHEQVLTSSGKLRKDYFVILSLQRTELNQGEAKEIEERAFKAFHTHITELLESESSTSLRDAVASVVLDAMTSTSRRIRGDIVRVFGPIKPAAKISEKSRPRTSGKYDIRESLPIIRDSIGVGVAKKIKTKTKKTKKVKKPSGAATNLIGILNAKLPRAVVGNMGAPALENVTGRFASGVRVVNVVQNKQQPTIQYTYQRNPYQIFEGQEPWAAGGARDPRRLIDKSIREIAAELAIARFNTQRI